MPILEAVVLGVIQGFTEFIPVSSSAHLIVVPWLCGWSDPGIAFDVSLHLGTLVALLAYFAGDWIHFGRVGLSALRERDFSAPDARIALGILLGTIPAAVAGVLGERAIDTWFHAEDPAGRARSMLIVAGTLSTLGLLLWLADRKVRHERSIADANLTDGIVIGLAQAFALIPGVSRSGSTITAGLFRGLDRPSAARYSFLLGAPIMAGAGLKKGFDIFRGRVVVTDHFAFVVGFAVSAVVGFWCIRFLLRFLVRNSTAIFVVYRLALAAALVLIVALSR